MYDGAMTLPSDGHKNDLKGFAVILYYSSFIAEELSTKMLKAISQFQNLNLNTCWLSSLAWG